jgi:hypothetical protein
MKQTKLPILSLLGLCCPFLLWGVFSFLASAAGRDFNEQIFGRYYTAGALLMLACYAMIVLGLMGSGIALGALARARNETPAWFPWMTLLSNMLASLAILRWLTH